MESTDYLPRNQMFFKLSEIKELGLMSIEQAKKMLYAGKMKGIKNGKMWLVPRANLLKYINEEMVTS